MKYDVSAITSARQGFRPGALSLLADRVFLIVVGAVVLIGVVVLIAPLVSVIGTSLNEPPALVFPPTTITFDAYRQIPSAWYAAFFVSIKLAMVAAFAASAIAVPTAFALTRGNMPGRAFIDAFVRSPLQVPQVVLSLSIYQYFSLMQTFTGANLFSGFRGLVLAHTLMVAPYIFGTVIGRIGSIDRSIEEASEGLGATPLRTFILVTLPMIRPALLAALILAFVISFDNVTLSLFLTAGASSTTLPVTLFTAFELSASPVVFAAAALAIIVSIIVTILLDRLIGLRAVIAR